VNTHVGVAPPSDWLLRWLHLLSPGRTALDLACGSGRHVRVLAGAGLQVTALDRNAAALAGLADVAGVDTVCADLESAAWPLAGRSFDLVLVTNYLWRPLFADIISAVDPGGLLIYETFALGQQTVGRPSRPEFLLRPGELLAAVQPTLQVLAFEDGWLPAQKAEHKAVLLAVQTADHAAEQLPAAPPRRVQRVLARRPATLAPASGDHPSGVDADWPQQLRLVPNEAS
jgi:SAM-dependent methyltransferase